MAEQKPKVFTSFLSSFLDIKKEEEKKKEVKPLGEEAKGGKYPKDGFRLIIDTFSSGVEANYYWFLRFMENKEDFGLRLSGERGRVEKLKDVFAAGEASALWGSIEQRKSLQQDKVSGYLATIGKMIKDLFQIVRELRILDERLDYYKGYNSKNDASCIALKSVWIDLVEGGAKNPGSVTGLASQVGFVILPDLFYKVHPQKEEDIQPMMKKFEEYHINDKVLEVLKRKLIQFLTWKNKTEKELNDRRKFTLKYLRQHFNVIRVYINWLKPYLTNINRLQMGTDNDPHLVSSFETSKVELELLGVKTMYEEKTPNGLLIDRQYKKYFPCYLVKFRFVALPEMSFQKEYQRAPMHMGRTEIFITSYVATQEEINAYKKKLEREDFALISSLTSSLDALGDTLFKYLEEAKEENVSLDKDDIIAVMEKSRVNKDKAIDALKKSATVEGAIEYLKKSAPQDSIFVPFKSVYEGFKEVLNINFESAKTPLTKEQEQAEKGKAKGEANFFAGILYDVYKKAHGMVTPL